MRLKLFCLTCGDITSHIAIIDPVERCLDSKCWQCFTVFTWTPTEKVGA